MAARRKIKGMNRSQAGVESDTDEQSLGEQLTREAKEGHAEFLAGWSRFMNELGVRGKPVGAKKLRETLSSSGINPADNEFSRGIIAMREE